MRNIFLILYLILFNLTNLYCGQENEIDLRLYEKRLISQNGEDGVLQKIFNLIGTTNKYYVEFGAGQGHFCSNTKYFREKYGWTGLLLEGSCQEDSSINLHKEFLTSNARIKNFQS